MVYLRACGLLASGMGGVCLCALTPKPKLDAPDSEVTDGTSGERGGGIGGGGGANLPQPRFTMTFFLSECCLRKSRKVTSMACSLIW